MYWPLQRGVVLKWFYSMSQWAVESPLSEVHALHRVPFYSLFIYLLCVFRGKLSDAFNIYRFLFVQARNQGRFGARASHTTHKINFARAMCFCDSEVVLCAGLYSQLYFCRQLSTLKCTIKHHFLSFPPNLPRVRSQSADCHVVFCRNG